MKRTRRGTTEASLSRLDRQCPTTSARRHKAVSNVVTEVEDVAATHDSNVDAEIVDVCATNYTNVEVDVEPTEPSQERELLRCMSKTSTIREWNWWANPNNGIFKWYIQRSGLEQLIRCSYRNANKIVVSTFIERWHLETNIFHVFW
ncbi:unnamed protein product [Prunus armeniaca]